RQPVGRADRRHDDGRHQQPPRAGGRRRPGQDRRARRTHPLHPAAPARAVPADRPRRGAELMPIAKRLPAALRDDTGGAVLYGLLAATAIAVPILTALPPSSALNLSPYVLTLLGKYLCYA